MHLIRDRGGGKHDRPLHDDPPASTTGLPGVVDASGQHAQLRVPQRHQLGRLVLRQRFGFPGCEELLDIGDDAGQQLDQPQLVAEAAAGLLLRVGCLVRGEGQQIVMAVWCRSAMS
ncbi:MULTISPECIES: hypothetical protein [unclassified Crossiella]|uniref:hypothetical protein n=1 Tax=unclassified Crossiella TaxID=2620835 RepID=UPI001FFE46E7|nr:MULTISPECIES: hypothetical protein [unclassified Crossiella]MCK2241904.1 hypothetical protein [Crossiella sp. S99.2]MCK2255807.1 hypothetical protein [Crossiella sp. S99.1]